MPVWVGRLALAAVLIGAPHAEWAAVAYDGDSCTHFKPPRFTGSKVAPPAPPTVDTGLTVPGFVLEPAREPSQLADVERLHSPRGPPLA